MQFIKKIKMIISSNEDVIYNYYGKTVFFSSMAWIGSTIGYILSMFLL